MLRTMTVAAMAAIVPWGVHAAGLSFSEGLSQFNVIVLGDAQVNSHVDGRTYVGGNLTGTGDFVQHPNGLASSSYSGLTVMGNAKFNSVNGLGTYVGGNLTGGNVNSGAARIKGNVSNSNINGSSKAAIGGTIKSSNINAGQLSGSNKTSALNSAAAVASSTDFSTVFNQGSSFLSGLKDTGGSVVFSNNNSKVTFNAKAGADGLAVFNLSSIDDKVFAAGEFSFNLNGAKGIIFNSDNAKITISANFLNGSASLGNQMLWNFYKATDVTLNNQFGGSIVATNAKLTNNNNIEGTVVVKTLYQNGEIHSDPFCEPIPSIPEPSTYALMALGVAMVSLVAAKRRSA
ncbi:choice-of-anchor A family protein [Curvibacter sp. CHRR-16]|nr:choice-of-anchor A family protein [Curvibacter sp. CHRR-16]